MLFFPWFRKEPPPPPGPDEHYLQLEIQALALLTALHEAVRQDSDNHHLEHARNHVSDVYVCLRRAERHRGQHHQEQAG